MMNQDYFIYNGIKYPSGTQLKLLRHPYDNLACYDIVSFIYYSTEHNTVWYKIARTGQNRGCSMEKFLQGFGGVTGKIDIGIHQPREGRIKDSKIPKLAIGWIWYIFIMFVAIIFNSSIVIWIVASIVFFSWRRKVIKKEGYYVEW